jgi:Xaa-Pro dipeptidase
MHKEQREQAHTLLKQRHIDQAVFAKPESVTWLTGFTPPVQVGPNLFAAGNPLVWYEDGHFTLIVVDAYAELAAPFGQESDGRLVTYVGNSLNEPIASGKHLLEVFEITAHIELGKIGIECEFVSDLIASHFFANTTVAIDGWLEPLRMIKTAEELATLRRNFALTDIGHVAAREATAVGKREIDVWNALHTAIQSAAGRRVPVGNDCIVGRRPYNSGGWPQDYELVPHDSLIVDISVVLDGYWSDSCATYFAGERTALQEKMHHAIRDALEFAISLARPGAIAKDIDQKTRQFIARAGYPVYPHHSGHGVGVSGHEAPRIVPYNDEVLREGMVIMLEPGTYIPGQTGVRLEDGLLITPDGAELLTHHDKS